MRAALLFPLGGYLDESVPLLVPDELDERSLVEAAQAEPARFLDLYDRHFHRVYAYVVRRAGSRAEAEDVTSEVFLYVDDCDTFYAQAIHAGATSLLPPADQPYGERMGGVADAWGNEWFIATPLGAP